MQPTRAALVLLALGTAPLAAQADTSLLAAGIQAYDDVEFARATDLLQRWFAAFGREASLPQQVLALSYLGAAESLRGNADSAEAAFTHLLTLAPRAAPDPLIFPPTVGRLFTTVRLRTRAAALTTLPRTEAGPDAPWHATLTASQPHEVVLQVRRADGAEMRTLFRGYMADTLAVEWDGRDRDGLPMAAGNYVLEVRSHHPSGAVERVTQHALVVERPTSDTLPHPPLPDSLLLPERRRAGPGIEALVGGVAVGALLALAPAPVAPDADLSPARFAVAGSVTIAGVIGFLTRRPGTPDEANRAHNVAVRADWRVQVDQIARENAMRRAGQRLIIRVGPGTMVTIGGR